jgi:hypothetical protein
MCDRCGDEIKLNGIEYDNDDYDRRGINEINMISSL